MKDFMKNILLTLIMTLPTLCFSQVDWSKAKITYGAENEVLPNIGDTIKEFYNESKILKSLKFRDATILTIVEFDENNTKTKSTIFQLNNLKYKTLTKFNEAGFVILIANYDNGVVTGKFQKFYSNGKLKEEGIYDKMKKIGEWKYFDEEGELIKNENH
jgi:antitoxin component YwqK of YwqJK toxin-antitoxin module